MDTMTTIITAATYGVLPAALALCTLALVGTASLTRTPVGFVRVAGTDRGFPVGGHAPTDVLRSCETSLD